MGGDIVVTSEPGRGSVFSVVVSSAVEAAVPHWPKANGLPVALALNSPLLARCLGDALRDLGLNSRVIDSPAMANAGEIVLTLSDLLAKHRGVKGAYNVCLTDVGDNHADGLIRHGVAVDLLPLPLGRQALWEFITRASRSEFRGADALGATQDPAQPKRSAISRSLPSTTTR